MARPSRWRVLSHLQFRRNETTTSSSLRRLIVCDSAPTLVAIRMDAYSEGLETRRCRNAATRLTILFELIRLLPWLMLLLMMMVVLVAAAAEDCVKIRRENGDTVLLTGRRDEAPFPVAFPSH